MKHAESQLCPTQGRRYLDYDLEALETSTRPMGCEHVFVAFQDSEGFDSTLLSDLIALFQYVLFMPFHSFLFLFIFIYSSSSWVLRQRPAQSEMGSDILYTIARGDRASRSRCSLVLPRL